MWLGAPFMNRNTQCFALAAKCGGLAASGLVAAAWASRDIRSSRARLAKPPPACHKNSLRVLVGIDKLVQIENHAAHLFERLALQEIQHGGRLGGLGRTRQRQPPRQIDLLSPIVARLPPQT